MTPERIDQLLDHWCAEYLWNHGFFGAVGEEHFSAVEVRVDKTLPGCELAVTGPGWRVHRQSAEHPFTFTEGSSREFLKTATELRLISGAEGEKYFL